MKPDDHYLLKLGFVQAATMNASTSALHSNCISNGTGNGSSNCNGSAADRNIGTEKSTGAESATLTL